MGGGALNVPQLPHRLGSLRSNVVTEQPGTTGEEPADSPKTWIPPHAGESGAERGRASPGVLILALYRPRPGQEDGNNGGTTLGGQPVRQDWSEHLTPISSLNPLNAPGGA